MHNVSSNENDNADNLSSHCDSGCGNHSSYYDIIVQQLGHHVSMSGCMACGAEVSAFAPADDRNIVEAHCKGLLGTFYCLVPDSITEELQTDERILVSCEDTIEIATVREAGEFVRIKRQKAGLYGEMLPHIIRKVDTNDLVTIEKNSAEELRATEVFKVKVQKYNLNMKLIDVHYQFDRNKLFFFYTADGRVDFRELAKDLASNFKTRIELRQIGVRDEAKRVGGIGTCGREFCCSSFLCNFKKITTQLATEQNLASNFSKLSGPCGKLKCCLSFESDHNNAQKSQEQA
ncbi:MAG TPA: regulatory iron-sulfur-containing complex subunit RicT [Ignavibacteriales bacterium]|nr:regulatory iron-sulfur-containing complex subunit RicT [Ignavibacteriales bacterium]